MSQLVPVNPPAEPGCARLVDKVLLPGLVEGNLLGVVQKVLWELKEMELLAGPRLALEEVSDYWLAELITLLMDNKCVLEVLRLMLVMQQDERDVPEELGISGQSGLSFFTSWLPTFYSSCTQERATSGVNPRHSRHMISKPVMPAGM